MSAAELNHRRFAPPFVGRVLLIDLDGTLVDTAPDLAMASNLMLRDLGLPALDPAVIRDFIGNGVPELVRLTLIRFHEPDPAELDSAIGVFRRHYAEHLVDHSRPYPTVPETLDRLRSTGRKLVCITNKPAGLTEPLLRAVGLREAFALVLSGDSLPVRKPDPAPLLYASAAFGVPVDEMLVVGDSPFDAEAALRAGMPLVCVSYGYNCGRDVREFKPDAVIESFSDLCGLLA